MITFFLLILVGVVSAGAILGSLLTVMVSEHMTKRDFVIALAVFGVSVPTLVTAIAYSDSIATTNAGIVERATECARSIP